MTTSRLTLAAIAMTSTALVACGGSGDDATTASTTGAAATSTEAIATTERPTPTTASPSTTALPSTTATAPPTTAAPIDGLPDGDYRTAAGTREAVLAAAVANGVPEAEAEATLDMAGPFQSRSVMIRLGDGGWTLYGSADGGPDELVYRMSYESVDEDTVVVSDGTCTMTMDYTLDGATLTFDSFKSECDDDQPGFAIGNLMNYRSGPFTRLDPRPAGTETAFATTDFAVPFDVTLPAWVMPAPVIAETHMMLFEGASADRAIRFVSPVSVYQPGDAATSPVPDDYVAYLLGLEAAGAVLTDVAETTVGGRPATLVTANTPESIDGALGCHADGLTPALCFGPQPELTLRIAVIQLDPAPLLVWLRDVRRPDDRNLETGTFDAMLASLEFRDN